MLYYCDNCIKQSSSMKPTASLKSLIVSANSLLADSLELDTFNRMRFCITAPTPHLVSISGSTECSLQNGQKQVLDASTLKYDKTGKISMATADGLGESDDLADNSNNASISAYCCEAYCEIDELNEASAISDLKRIAQESKTKNAMSQDGLPYDGRTAMSAITYNPRTKRAKIVSVGDTLTVIFDGKTGALKFQQEARVYNQGGAIWAPVDLQMLAHSKLKVAQFAESALQINQWDLEESDIVVQMTDGIWSQFNTEDSEVKITKDVSYLATRLTIKNINELGENSKEEQLPETSALTIAQKLHHYAIRAFRNNLSLFQEIHPEILAKLELEPNGSKKTMREFVKALPSETAIKFQQLYVAQKHDSIMYDDDLPVIVFRQQYRKISFGDCATISVLKVPEMFESILDRLLNNIELLADYAAEVKIITELADEKIEALFNKIARYRVIEEIQPLTKAPGVLAYPNLSLTQLKNFVQQLKDCKKIAEAESNVYLKREKTLAYVNSISDEPSRGCLANFLSKNLSFVFKEERHFSLFGSKQGITAKDFKTQMHTLGASSQCSQ